MRGEGRKGEREMKREGINLAAKVPESILRVPATLATAAMVSFNTGITFLIAFPFVFLKHGIIDEIYFFQVDIGHGGEVRMERLDSQTTTDTGGEEEEGRRRAEEEGGGGEEKADTAE